VGKHYICINYSKYYIDCTDKNLSQCVYELSFDHSNGTCRVLKGLATDKINYTLT